MHRASESMCTEVMKHAPRHYDINFIFIDLIPNSGHKNESCRVCLMMFLCIYHFSSNMETYIVEVSLPSSPKKVDEMATAESFQPFFFKRNNILKWLVLLTHNCGIKDVPVTIASQASVI